MLKQHKRLWFLTAGLTLAPILAGLILWDRLPDTMVTHWGADGVADGWSRKGFAVFVLPLILLAIHGLCLLITVKDKGNQNQSKKALAMVFWIMPVTSWFSCGTMYFAAMGKGLELISLVPAFMGLVFAIMGNYMPKVKQNRTLGVKLPWTLANEENWNKTHRYCGRIWVIGGLVLLFCVFLPDLWMIPVMSVVLPVMVLAPTLYSLKLYRIHQKQGIVYDFAPKNKKEAMIARISLVAVILILAGVSVLMFTGEIEFSLSETDLAIESTYWVDFKVPYTSMDQVEYREDFDPGVRTNGFGSARLSMGAFHNEEFGEYTLYAYGRTKSAIIITSGERTLVLSASSEVNTRLLYEGLVERTN